MRQFIAVTCHYDVVDWLDPDWVFCTDTMEFDRKKGLGRPLNSRFIGAALPSGKWFRQYHYLRGTLASTARCYFTVYQDKPIAFIAVVHIHMKSRYYRVTRLVVLPDYQGLGVGKRLLNFIAELYTSQTKVPFYILTSNPQIIRGNIENWKITRFGHASKGRGNTRINNEIRSSLSRKRITVSMQFVPTERGLLH